MIRHLIGQSRASYRNCQSCNISAICRLSALVDRTVLAQKQIMLLIIDTMVSAMIGGEITLNEKYLKQRDTRFGMKAMPLRNSAYFTSAMRRFITCNSSSMVARRVSSILLQSSWDDIACINPARLVYWKFCATIARGMAGNNVTTATRVLASLSLWDRAKSRAKFHLNYNR